jgi:HSP20 family protein
MTKTKSKSVEVKQAKESELSQPFEMDQRSISLFSSPLEGSLFAPIQSLRHEIDEMFNQFANRFELFSHNGRDDLRVPSMDIEENDNSFEIMVEMPGVDQKDVEVTVSDATLSIFGEKEQSKESGNGKRRVSECSYGAYERALSLPFSVDAKDVKASYDNGVLHMTVPKPPSAANKPQKVKIKTAA